MSKGVSGKVLTLVISLIIAIIALVLLWLFMDKIMPFISDLTEKIIKGVACQIVRVISGPAKPIGEWWAGC